MAIAEILREDVTPEFEKKVSRLRSIQSHLGSLTVAKSRKAALISEVTEFDSIIAGIVSSAKQDEINACDLVVRIKNIMTTLVANQTGQVNGQRADISGINDLVQADADYTQAEKDEFTALKDNEV